MSKGTILYVGGFELPDRNAAAHRVLGNGKIFRELGYNVVFIGIDKSLNYDSDILSTNNNVQGFDCWSVPYPNTQIEWLKYLTSINFINMMNEKYSDIKVVVAYNYPALALRNLKKYCVKNHIKIIADCTEWYSTKGSNIVFKVIKGLDSFFRMRVIQKQLDGLIVISKYLETYYQKCKNVIRIPPLVDINEEKWDPNIGKINKGNVADKRLRLVYSGSPGINKDKINYIIDALYILKESVDYQMDIVGVSRAQFIKDYPNYKEKINALEKRVNFVGRVSHEESLRKLKNADYSIFIREKSRLTMAGFPTKFVESITCSTPVITSNSSDINEYFLDNSYGFLINDGSAEKIVGALNRIIKQDVYNTKSYTKLNNRIFDYKGYIEVVSKLLDDMMQ